jgi:hypothetical protein
MSLALSISLSDSAYMSLGKNLVGVNGVKLFFKKCYFSHFIRGERIL